MTQHWQELLPIDRYIVTANGLLHDYDRKVLTFLYQPLLGAKLFKSLYDIVGRAGGKPPLV